MTLTYTNKMIDYEKITQTQLEIGLYDDLIKGNCLVSLIPDKENIDYQAQARIRLTRYIKDYHTEDKIINDCYKVTLSDNSADCYIWETQENAR